MEVIVIAVLIILIGVIVKSAGDNKTLKDENLLLRVNLTERDESIKQKNIQILENEKDLSSLKKYQPIVDIEKEVKTLLNNAEANAKNIVREAYIKAEAFNQEAREINERNKARINKAEIEAEKLVAEAQKEAERTARDAIRALHEKDQLENAIKAIKNIMHGYGDDYMIPTYTLLDDLADEFQHTDAGQKLKEAREHTKFLVKYNKAAYCEYVEDNRRETALKFVIDAFNGKVDSVLAKIKKDNYGVLAQKISDAFNIVNFHGKAFRNASITKTFLEARLEELKWAVITQEFKWQEQEEQRLIKEQIREEEKALREIERALREAEKEEETLKKAIEKAQKQVEDATEQQKAKYEEKLRELEDRLKIAEEKGQRALSMAQQTKSGNVYIISNVGSFGEEIFKIGMTRRLDPLDRVKELGDASVPFEFDVHAMIYNEDAPRLEHELHRKFLHCQVNKVNPRKEFFRIGINDIKTVIDEMGINTKWTMTADAKSYKESLAIEKAMKGNDNIKKDWEESQLKIERFIEQEEILS